MPNHFSVVAIASNNPLTLDLQLKHRATDTQPEQNNYKCTDEGLWKNTCQLGAWTSTELVTQVACRSKHCSLIF